MSKPDIPDFFVNPNKPNGFDPDDFLSKNKITIILVLLGIFLLPNIFIIVGAGQKAVIFNRVSGMEKRVLSEGVQLVIPLLEKATVYDVRKINYVFDDDVISGKKSLEKGTLLKGGSIHTLTSDGQNIQMAVTARIRPNFDELWWLHQNLGQDYESTYIEKIIVPIVKSTVREVASGYQVDAVYSKAREEMKNKIQEAIAAKFKQYKLELVELLLERVVFSDAYQAAIEEKQEAVIELGTKDNIIAEETSKRDAAIIKAQGEAQAIRLKVNALTQNPSYLKFRRAQVFGKRAKLVLDDSL